MGKYANVEYKSGELGACWVWCGEVRFGAWELGWSLDGRVYFRNFAFVLRVLGMYVIVVQVC